MIETVYSPYSLRPRDGLHQTALEDAQHSNMSNEEWLAANVIIQAKRDYQQGGRQTRKQIEWFLRDSPLFNLFCDAQDMDAEIVRRRFLETAGTKVRFAHRG